MYLYRVGEGGEKRNLETGLYFALFLTERVLIPGGGRGGEEKSRDCGLREVYDFLKGGTDIMDPKAGQVRN